MDKKIVEGLIRDCQMDIGWATGKLNLMRADSSGSVANESSDLINSLEYALKKAKKLRLMAFEGDAKKAGLE